MLRSFADARCFRAELVSPGAPKQNLFVVIVVAFIVVGWLGAILDAAGAARMRVVAIGKLLLDADPSRSDWLLLRRLASAWPR